MGLMICLLQIFLGNFKPEWKSGLAPPQVEQKACVTSMASAQMQGCVSGEMHSSVRPWQSVQNRPFKFPTLQATHFRFVAHSPQKFPKVWCA
jgi:hypothetical protein